MSAIHTCVPNVPFLKEHHADPVFLEHHAVLDALSTQIVTNYPHVPFVVITVFVHLQHKAAEMCAIQIVTVQLKDVPIVTGQVFVCQEENATLVVKETQTVIEFPTAEIVSIMSAWHNVDKLVNTMVNVKMDVIYVGVVSVFLKHHNLLPLLHLLRLLMMKINATIPLLK